MFSWCKKHSLTLLGCLFIVLVIANLFVFFTREWESSHYPAQYATLYYPSDCPVIRSWDRLDRQTLKIDIGWNQPVRSWLITCDALEAQTAHGKNPVFRLVDDEMVFHSYTITPLPEGIGPEIVLSIRFVSQEFYAKRNMKHIDIYSINTPVPYGNFKQYPVSDWIDDYGYVGKQNLAKADRIVREQAGVIMDEPTLVKMEKLTAFLRRQLMHARGVPKDDFRWKNPWLIYQEMVNGTGKGWCTQHAQIWTFFANRAGIPTRFVQGSVTDKNHFVYTGHAWAESWIAEQQRWAFVDLAHSHIAVFDKDGLVLNTVELFFLNQHGQFDSTYARIYKDWEWKHLPGETDADSIATLPFASNNRVVRTQFLPQSIFKYRRPPNVEDIRALYSQLFQDAAFGWGNIERYLFKPPLAFSLYPTTGTRTYHLRQALLAGMAIALILWISVAVRRRFLVNLAAANGSP